MYEVRVILENEEFFGKQGQTEVTIAAYEYEESAVHLAKSIKAGQGNPEEVGVLPIIAVIMPDADDDECLVWWDGQYYPNRPTRG